MKKKILLILLLGLLALMGSLFYLNTVFLPTKIKSIIITSLEKQLNAKVNLENLSYRFLKGIEINNLSLYEAGQKTAEPIVTIKKVTFNVLYLPIFRNKTIVIPNIKIDSPTISIIRYQNDLWNLSNLQTGHFGKDDFTFLVYRISITHAKIYFKDQTLTPSFSYAIPELNARASLSLPKNIRFKLEAKLSPQSTASLLFSQGDFDLADNTLTASLRLNNIDALEFKPYYNLPFEIKSAVAREVNFDISGRKDKILIACRASSENLNITAPPYDLKANCLINFQLELNPASPQNASISGSAEISGASLKGIEILKDITGIKGAVTFNANEIKTDDLQGTAQQIPMAAQGRLSDFSNPLLELKLFAAPSLEKLSEIFSEQLKKWNFEVAGRTQLELTITSRLSEEKGLIFKGNCRVQEANLAVPQLAKPLKDINGLFEFDKESLRWEKLSLDYSGTTFVSNGLLTNFTNPHLELILGSKLLSLSSNLDIQDKNLDLNQLTGKYLNSAFAFKGSAGLDNPDNPLLDLTGNIKLELKDLNQLLPDYQSRLEGIKPLGLVDINLVLQGKLNNRRQWYLDASANSQEISLQGLRLNHSNLSYLQQDGQIKNLSLSATAYSGTVDILASGSLLKEGIPVVVNANIKDIDLALLKLDTPWKDKSSAGKFSFSTELKGPLQDIKNMRGLGSLVLTDGNLWELNLLKGLGNLLFIPEFQKIIFKEASAEFVVENNAVYTNNLQIKSSEMDLSAEGAVDFSGKLNFTVTALINQELVQNSSSLKKFITSILSSASGAIVVKISGDLQKPKYKIIPATVDIIKRAKEFILEDILR